MKRVGCLMLTFVILMMNASAAFAMRIDSTEIDALHAPIEEYIQYTTACIANLKLPDYKNLSDNASAKANEFAEIENIMLSTQLASLSADAKYENYELTIDYYDVSVNEDAAIVEAAAVCKFNYVDTPNIQSETGRIFRFELNKNQHGEWEIVDRENTTTFDKMFWGSSTRTLDNAKVIATTISAAKAEAPIEVSEQISENEIAAPLAAYDLYSDSMRADAASTAIDYVAPDDDSEWVPGKGWTYTYPSGYSQKTLDCANFVSFCLNYGGGIPQDNTGSYKWTPSRSSWTSVDYLLDYLLASKSTSEKGIVASQTYSNNSFPSTSTLKLMDPGDVVLFSSSGEDDWTHSAIITSVSATGTTYICSHDAQNYDYNVNLQTFYNNMYANTAQLIKLIRISGFYD